MEYNIQLKVYEGPMNLLYDLVRKHKVDIKDISIIELTDQYLAYINSMQGIDMEFASEFIIMASKLLEIKSKYLLYLQKDEEEDPRMEIIQKLEEYKIYKKASEYIKDNISDYENIYYRKKEEQLSDEDNDEVMQISLSKILEIIPKIFKIDDTEKILKKNKKLNTIIKKKIISIEFQIQKIKKIFSTKQKTTFVSLVKGCEKDEIIATFLAVLEMMKEKEVLVEQEGFFNLMTIRKRESSDEEK